MTELLYKHNKEINFIIDHNYLTEQEKEFIDSIQINLSKEIDTTSNQQKNLNEIYSKVQDEVG